TSRWPGRMERLSNEALVVLDGAHNTHAMNRLVENLKKEFKGYQINILFSALRTKNVREMLERLQQVPNVHIYLTTLEHPKAIELSEESDLGSERVS
ncbi:cyanophycin synthetase, partial [Enterococcus faecium]|uniref:glutamate ligase domain-containing protein n=1 Tax=Enterococcus faecium TaxID=1352 RepID=UPI0031CD88DB